jgi:tRNA pseudouridine55 synthase
MTILRMIRANDCSARSRQPMTNRNRHGNRRVVDGLLLLDKPLGPTSNGILQKVKWLFNARKAGHTGSLDPLASGMLPLCFGQATKLSAYLLDSDKVYRVTAQFGVKTDTADAGGAVIQQTDDASVERSALDEVLQQFIGDIEQIPPMYSALKKDGKRLYELARQGKVVDRQARPVRIYSIDVEEYDPISPVLRVHCSKGTYIRTLIEDIAVAAGTLGHVAALRRLWVRPFREAEMVSMEQLEAAAEGGEAALDDLLLPLDRAIEDWPAVHLSQPEAHELLQGHTVNHRPGLDPGLVRLYDEMPRFLGIGEVLPDGRVAPRRRLLDLEEERA